MENRSPSRTALTFEGDSTLEAAKRRLVASVSSGLFVVGLFAIPLLLLLDPSGTTIPTAVLWSIAFFSVAQLLALILARSGRLIPAALMCAWVMMGACTSIAFLVPQDRAFAVPSLMFLAVPVLLVSVILGPRWTIPTLSIAVAGVLGVAVWSVEPSPWELFVAPGVMLAVVTAVGVAGYRTEAQLWGQARARHQELEIANAELTRATTAKSDFLSNMSHELRTPLNSILGFSGTLLAELAGPLTQEQRLQLSMVRTSGHHLLEMINSLLDLSRIESGSIDVDAEKVDLVELCNRAVSTVRPLADTAGIELSCDSQTPELIAWTDGRRVTQILFNLLGNAIKFTDEGSVRCDIMREGDQARLVVTDTGCGIPTEQLDRIFEPFYQVRPDEGGKTAGTGLGLTVSSQLAQALGGSLEAESEPDSGCRFTLVLPVIPVSLES